MTLSPDDFEALINRYYRGEPVSSLIDEYGLSVHPSRLVRIFPPATSDEYCPYCDVPMVCRYVARNRSGRRTTHPAECPTCGHKQPGRCSCQRCQQRREDGEAQRRKRILKALEDRRSSPPRDCHSLSLTESLYLVSLVRAGATQDLSRIRPPGNHYLPMAPTEWLTHRVLGHLLSAGLISIDPQNSPENSLSLTDNDTIHYDASLVHWELHCVGSEVDHSVSDALACGLADRDWLDGGANEVLDLWRELAVHECLAFMNDCMAQRSLPAPSGVKTVQAIQRLLRKFSVGQSCNFIFRAARNAVDFQSTRRVTRSHAANTIPGYCERQAEKAIYEGWDVKAFPRNSRIPESVMAALFATSVAQLGDMYWYSPPNEQSILIS